MVLQIGKMESSTSSIHFLMLPALRVGLGLKQKGQRKEKGQLCLMSHLALWMAQSSGLCLFVCAQKLRIYSLVMGTSIAKQLGECFIVVLKETPAPAEYSFLSVLPLLSSPGPGTEKEDSCSVCWLLNTVKLLQHRPSGHWIPLEGNGGKPVLGNLVLF